VKNIRKTTTLVITSWLASAAAGCAVAPTETEESPSASSAAQTRVVAQVATPTGSIEFLDLTGSDGVPRIAISELSRVSAGVTPTQKALRQEASTSLEVFMAVSTEAPPDALVEAHGLEAMELGRDNDAIVPLEIELDDFVEKLSPTTCSSYLRAAISANEIGEYSSSVLLNEDNLTQTKTSTASATSPFAWVYSAICNDSPSATIGTHYYATANGYADKVLFSQTLAAQYLRTTKFNWHFDSVTPVRYKLLTYNHSGGSMRYHRRIWDPVPFLR
jgi:hypothetical protein